VIRRQPQLPGRDIDAVGGPLIAEIFPAIAVNLLQELRIAKRRQLVGAFQIFLVLDLQKHLGETFTLTAHNQAIVSALRNQNLRAVPSSMCYSSAQRGCPLQLSEAFV
jgi:hypothetical protein